MINRFVRYFLKNYQDISPVTYTKLKYALLIDLGAIFLFIFSIVFRIVENRHLFLIVSQTGALILVAVSMVLIKLKKPDAAGYFLLLGVIAVITIHLVNVGIFTDAFYLYPRLTEINTAFMVLLFAAGIFSRYRVVPAVLTLIELALLIVFFIAARQYDNYNLLTLDMLAAMLTLIITLLFCGYLSILAVSLSRELMDIVREEERMGIRTKQDLSEIIALRTQELEQANRELFIEKEELTEKSETIEEQLQLARKIQSNFIPRESPVPYLAFHYRPMELVGGDYFDFIRFRDGRIGILISDVSGHGLAAAFITSMIKSFVLKQDQDAGDPAEFLLRMNEYLYNQIPEIFVTAFYGVYNPLKREFVYSSAGHNPPLIINRAGVDFIDTGNYGVILAVMTNSRLMKRGFKFVNQKMRLERGNKLLFYTDGLTEAVNIRYVQKDPKEMRQDFEAIRLFAALRGMSSIPPAELLDRLMQHLVEFRGSDSFSDDICLVCMEVK